MLSFSILMSVYHKESPEFLEEALNSLILQSVLPSEIVLIKDGPLTIGLDRVITNFKRLAPMSVVDHQLQKNVGLGLALKVGLELCNHSIIARMDSDDISANTRFETQLKFLIDNPNISVVGSSIEDFNSTPGDLGILRVLPISGEKLLNYAKYRSPVNHATIMFRKNAVIEAGNYSGDIRLFEDYALFIKMIIMGCQFYNLEEVLYFVRVGPGIDAIKRRSGIHYIKSEIKFLRYAHRIKFLSNFELLKSYCLKIPIRLLPPKILYSLYNKFLRKKRI